MKGESMELRVSVAEKNMLKLKGLNDVFIAFSSSSPEDKVITCTPDMFYLFYQIIDEIVVDSFNYPPFDNNDWNEWSVSRGKRSDTP